MAKRISLREFQEGLARRLAQASTTDRRTLLGVEAGGQNWLLPLEEAGEILPVPPLAEVPLTQSWFRGLANVRGTLHGVVDFGAWCGGSATPPLGNARLVLVGAKHGINSAILVSRALGLRSPDDFEPDESTRPDPQPWLEDTWRDVQGRPWLRLNISALLHQSRFLEAGIES